MASAVGAGFYARQHVDVRDEQPALCRSEARDPFCCRPLAAAATGSGRGGFLLLARTERFGLGVSRAVYEMFSSRRAILGHDHAGSLR